MRWLASGLAKATGVELSSRPPLISTQARHLRTNTDLRVTAAVDRETEAGEAKQVLPPVLAAQ